MGRAEAGSTKAIANAIKAKGLGRLRWYCQVCEKQCRDENGFQAHTKSEPHLRKILLIGPKANQAIGEYSSRFQKEFMALLKTRHQTTRVRANKVYNEYIQDKHHVHMNGTHWVSLSGFIASIGKAGLVKVDDDGKDLWIQWVDNRPETLEKQAATKKKERAQMDGEERERAMLEAQIARAKEQAGQQTLPEVGLQKKEGEKITLNLFNAPPPTTDPSGSATPEEKAEVKLDGETAAQNGDVAQKEESKPTITFGTIGTSFKPPVAAAVNPLKRPAGGNIFKAAKSAKTDSETTSSSSKKSGYMSEAERLMKEDQARRIRNGGGGGYAGAGPRREGNGPAPKRFVLQ